MNFLPKTWSAANWLWIRQTSRTFSTVDLPPIATGMMWSYSSSFRDLQRCPFVPT